MTNEEKQDFQTDLQKYTKQQEGNTKVAAFFNNLDQDQEIDDSSPRHIDSKEISLKPNDLAHQNDQKSSPLDPINPRKYMHLLIL